MNNLPFTIKIDKSRNKLFISELKEIKKLFNLFVKYRLIDLIAFLLKPIFSNHIYIIKISRVNHVNAEQERFLEKVLYPSEQDLKNSPHPYCNDIWSFSSLKCNSRSELLNLEEYEYNLETRLNSRVRGFNTIRKLKFCLNLFAI